MWQLYLWSINKRALGRVGNAKKFQIRNFLLNTINQFLLESRTQEKEITLTTFSLTLKDPSVLQSRFWSKILLNGKSIFVQWYEKRGQKTGLCFFRSFDSVFIQTIPDLSSQKLLLHFKCRRLTPVTPVTQTTDSCLLHFCVRDSLCTVCISMKLTVAIVYYLLTLLIWSLYHCDLPSQVRVKLRGLNVDRFVGHYKQNRLCLKVAVF